MKKERRWLKSALHASAQETVYLPWLVRKPSIGDIDLPGNVRKTPITPTPQPFATAAR